MTKKVEKKVLGKADILSANDMKIELLDVEEWGGSVYIRSITASARDDFETSSRTVKKDAEGKETTEFNSKDFRARFCATVMCDENGAPLFTIEEAHILGQKSAKALDRVFEAGSKLNGMFKEALEEARKNSGTMPEGGSTSDSPSPSAAQ